MTHSENYVIDVDALALGLTRPPMFMGINLRLFFSNLIFSLLICVNTHTFWGVPIFIVLHVLMLMISAKEPDFFRIWTVSLAKTPPTLNSWYWKTNSYEPW